MLTSLIAVLALLVPQSAASTPMRSDSGNRPVIEVMVDGQGPFDFVVDTAAQTHVVMPRLVERLSLQPEAAEVAVQGASGRQAARFHMLDSVSAGAFSQNNVRAVALPNGSATEAWGIIGMAHFATQRVMFDRTANLFSLSPSGPPAEGMTAVPATLFSTFAIVDVLIDGAPVKAVIDSGAARTVANEKVLTALGWAADDARLTAGRAVRGATTHETQARVGRVGEFDLGAASFADVDITFSDLSVFQALGLADQPALILGSDILNRLPAYAIDYPRRELQIRTAGSSI